MQENIMIITAFFTAWCYAERDIELRWCCLSVRRPSFRPSVCH